jgi:hypothetical protein
MKKLITALLAGAFAFGLSAAYAQMNTGPRTGNAPNGVDTSTSGVEKDETIPKSRAKSGMKRSGTRSSVSAGMKAKKSQTTGSGSYQGTTSKPAAGVDKD